MLDQSAAQQGNVTKLVVLCILGAVLAGVAELPYGGWIQIPLLSLIWWQLKQLHSPSLKNSFGGGMAFGLGYFTLGLWWLFISLHDIGGMNTLLSCAAVLLLSLYTALFFAAACLPLFYFRQSPLLALTLGASWVLLEYLRGMLFTGFPWLGLAETQVNGPFGLIAPYLGGLGCTFLVVWISLELTNIKKSLAYSLSSILVVLAIAQMAGLLQFTKPSGEPVSVRLIQGNFEQSLKFNPKAIQDQIAFYVSQIRATPADLIVIPETAMPWPQSNLPTGLMTYLQNFADTNSSTILIGLIGEVSDQSDARYSNRAAGLSPNLPPYQYDKAHLVPFGEFIPYGFRWFVNAFNVPMSDFARGSLDQAPLSIHRKDQTPVSAVITICYEDAFGGELASRLRESGQEAKLLINMTNLAWFGISQAPSQQLRLSQLRSLETGLPALRATNTGVTAVLAPNGSVLAQLPQFTQANLNTQVQAYAGKTPYVRWGNGPILGLACLLLVLAYIRQKRF